MSENPYSSYIITKEEAVISNQGSARIIILDPHEDNLSTTLGYISQFIGNVTPVVVICSLVEALKLDIVRDSDLIVVAYSGDIGGGTFEDNLFTIYEAVRAGATIHFADYAFSYSMYDSNDREKLLKIVNFLSF